MKLHFIPPVIRKKSGGFTLMEMMITLAIFILLSTAVFGIIAGVLHSASVLQDNQNRRDQLVAFNDYLNRQLKELPNGSILVSYRRGDGEGLKQNGIIFGQGENLTAIDAVQQPNGYHTLRMTTLDPSTLPKIVASPIVLFEAQLTQNDPGLAWTPLIRDIRHIEWKFQMFNMTEWQEIWNDSVNKPNLVEVTLEQAGDLQPVVMDFWLPPVAPINVKQGLTPVSADPSTTNH